MSPKNQSPKVFSYTSKIDKITNVTQETPYSDPVEPWTNTGSASLMTLRLVGIIYKNGIQAKLETSQLDNIVVQINKNTNTEIEAVLDKIDGIKDSINNSFNEIKDSMINDTYNLLTGTSLPFKGTLIDSKYMGNNKAHLYETDNGLALVKWYDAPTSVGDLIIG